MEKNEFLLVVVTGASPEKFEKGQEIYSSSEKTTTAVKADSSDSDNVIDTVQHKSRGLNLGLLLFRR